MRYTDGCVGVDVLVRARARACVSVNGPTSVWVCTDVTFLTVILQVDALGASLLVHDVENREEDDGNGYDDTDEDPRGQQEQHGARYLFGPNSLFYSVVYTSVLSVNAKCKSPLTCHSNSNYSMHCYASVTPAL